jgi:arylsulfatase B
MDFISKQMGKTTPFFLYYALQDPHTPLESPSYFQQQAPCSSSSRKVYCGMMKCIDTAVQSVMSAISSAGFLDNTLVVFAGDNGGSPKNGGYNWPMRGSKGTLYEGGVRQASFAWGAMINADRRGTTYHGAIHLVDFFPTFMALASSGRWQGVSGQTLDGVNVWQGIATGAASARNETLINAVDSAGAIRIGNFKLMISQGTDSWCVSHSIPFIIAPCTQIVTVRLFVSRTSLSPTCGCCILFHSLSRLDCAL